ncbi:hypothetical protein AB0K08_07300 [Citricoccus sp. NPDC055426]|uniref:hypothetical protein n=1 Tax=Citricoccus sp. NPDC055426 TaxID=3155536 RepID=UPI003438A48A
MPAGVGRPGLLEGLEARGRYASPGEPPSFSVRGGPGSIHANLDELERGSLLLTGATDEAAALSLRAAGWGSLISVAAAHTVTGRVLPGRTAELSAGLMAVSAEASVLAVAVRTAARTYREAETAARRRMEELLGPVAFVGALGLGLSGQPLPLPLTELALQATPEVLAGVLGLMAPGLGRGFLIASEVAGRAARDEGATGALSGPEQLYPLVTALGRATGLVQIGPVRLKGALPPADQWDQTWAPEGEGSISNVMSHLDLARGAAPGSIQITRFTPDGPGTSGTVWLVSLPGTQTGDYRDASGWSTNPWDVGGNAEAMALDSQHVSAAVGAALRAAGAGQDDALVLTGYSQGGLHAARIAADERIAETYDVQGLFTIGSPTGEIRVPATVEAGHLEHDEDFPAALDGRANPQAANRATITVSGYDESLYPEGKDLMSGHSFDNYGFHAALLDQDPDVARQAPAIEHIAALTAGGGVTRSVQFERIRPGNPRHPFGAGSSSSFATHPDGRRAGTGVRPGVLHGVGARAP